MAEKEKFLANCNKFKNELSDLQRDIDEQDETNNGTLAYIGCNYSYELANIGFELGYACWHFLAKGNFKDVKQSFIDTIIENEIIEGVYSINEIKKIRTRLLKVRSDKNGNTH